MKAHAATTVGDRTAWSEEIRQEIQGRPPKGPFEFAEDLNFDNIADPDAGKKGPMTIDQRLKAALVRDCRHITAGPVFIRLFGFNQALRSVYDGGRQLIDGGVTE